MALSDDLRERVVKAVVEEGPSRNGAAKRFGVGIASAVRWVVRFKAFGTVSLPRWAGTAARSASRRTAIICSASIVASLT